MGRLQVIGFSAAFLAGGAIVGWAYFRLMGHSLRYLGRGRGGTARFAGLAVLRMALLCAGAAAALYTGVWPFITYTAGFLAARTVAVGGFRPAGRDAEKTAEKVETNG